MGKFPSPSWCCSCSCFSSPSSQTGPSTQPPNAGPSTSPSSSQPSQQPPNVVTSTPPSSSQPSQQPVTAGPSTPPSSSSQLANAGPSTTPFSSQPSPTPSSSQPTPQPTNAVPSTATTTDLQSSLRKFNNISQLDDLIKFIEYLLEITSGEKNEGGPSSKVYSYIQDGQTLLEFVDKHIQKKDSMEGLGVETQKILINLLKGAGKIHWVGAALSVVGFVLARYNEMSNNRRECLEILKAKVNLGKQIVELNEQMPEQEQKLNEAVECIVVGCSICTSQLATAKIFRFLTASVNAESLKAFQARIDRLYNDLQLWGIIQINKEQPKFAPPSQDHYGYKPAVGIDSAREEVIRLLDLSAQHTSPQAVVVVVHGFGGIGKTTLADDVYKNIDLQSYKHCRIHMVQHCTETDLKSLQEQILNGLFNLNVKLRDCDEGQGMIWSHFTKNRNQPLFLYIDNGLLREDLKKLLPANVERCQRETESDENGYVIVHDIVRARRRKMSEGNRIRDRESLLDCLKDEEKLRDLKGIYFDEPSEQPPIEINEYHLNCMSNSLRKLFYTEASQITFRGKCHKPFKQLRYLANNLQGEMS